MDFSEALTKVRLGHKIARAGWNGRDMHVEYVGEVTDERMLPFLALQTAQGDLVPWLASQTDLLATDWHVTPQPMQRGDEIKLLGSSGSYIYLDSVDNLNGQIYAVLKARGGSPICRPIEHITKEGS